MISVRTMLEAGAALAFIVALQLADQAGYRRGKNDEVTAQAGRNAIAATKARIKTDQAADVSAGVGAAVETATAKERVVTQTLIREVIKYVPASADAQCVVPVGFVRLHDQAAAGLLPQASGPAGEPADAPSNVALSAVGATVAENYGGCRQDAEKLKGWQDYWAGVSPFFKQ